MHNLCKKKTKLSVNKSEKTYCASPHICVASHRPVNPRQIDVTEATALLTKPPAMLTVCWVLMSDDGCGGDGETVSWGAKCGTASHSSGKECSSAVRKKTQY